MSSYVFMTGATGLLGRYLIRDLLLAGQRLAVLVRPTAKETGRQRIETILQYWEAQLGRLLPRPVCLEGDFCEEMFGLDAVDLRWIAENCDRVLHNAASLTFYGTDRAGEPWRTNVEGTRNLLRTCDQLGLRDIHDVSTAYVCGNRPGLIREDELDLGQSFRNDYEQSKLQSEQLFRNDTSLNSLTVYRPAVIAGDSQTGYTSTYHGLYMYLKLMAVLVRNLEPDADGMRRVDMRMNVDGDEPRNIVPVDWVSAVITHLLRTPDAHGRTYHLAPADPITTRQIIDYTGTYLNSTGVQYVGRKANVEDNKSHFEQSAYENMTMYESYDTTDPQFDMTNLNRFAPHLPCPRMDEQMIHLFMRFGDEDRWGKRRMPAAPVSQWSEDLLGAALDDSDSRRSERTSRIVGLDILGPGGGQWAVRLAGHKIVDVAPGLPDQNVPVFQVDTSLLCDLVSGRNEQPAGTMARHVNSVNGVRLRHLPGQFVRALQRRKATTSRLVGSVAENGAVNYASTEDEVAV